ncbi:type II secretion system protein [Anaerolentibacter hominis]|uniref:type II secretion system protein n=1 Tax=Anaerolentibacter hominis TaxID=3079009 RepID=UPI0031B82950
MKKNKKGFTLVELIVVIAILVILVGLLAPNVIRYIEKSRIAKDEAALDNAYQSIVLALADEKAYEQAILKKVDDVNGASFETVLLKNTTVASKNFTDEVVANYGSQTAYAAKSSKYSGSPIHFTLDMPAGTEQYQVSVFYAGHKTTEDLVIKNY